MKHLWWSHFQVQGHIFGQVVTLYQICCTKTYKAFSVKLSAFLFGAPRRCIKRWRFGLHGPGGSEHFQEQVAVRKSCGTRRYHGEAILIFSVRTNTAGDIRLRVKIKYFKHTVFILAAVDAYKPFYF